MSRTFSRLAVYASVVLGLLLGSSPTLAAPARTVSVPAQANAETVAYCVEPVEVEFLGYINAYRADFGLGALRMSQTAGAAAEHHSVEMATANYFSHELLNGVGWSHNMINHGYTYNAYRGENIAAGYAGAWDTFLLFKGSPAHNAAMLDSKYTVIGIGRAFNDASTYKYYWTTDFASYTDGAAVICGQSAPAPAQPIATDAPTQPATVTPTTTTTTKFRGGGKPGGKRSLR